MTPQGPNYHTTASTGYFKTTEAQEINDLKLNLMEIIEASKDEKDKSIKEMQENIISQMKEMTKLFKTWKNIYRSNKTKLKLGESC
jgi:hydrogenase maturation factor HypE